MRFTPAILMLLLTGCSLPSYGVLPGQSSAGRVAACGTDACGNDAATGGDCETTACEPDGSGSHCPPGLSFLGLHHGKKHSQYFRTPDNILTKMEARHQAQSDLRKFGRDQCVTCDYRLGYEQAYVDVSLGACGDVPALPPANYWKNCARSPEGHAKAQQWFSGYAAGAAQAKAIYEPYNVVAHSQFDFNDWSGSQSNCNTQFAVDPNSPAIQ